MTGRQSGNGNEKERDGLPLYGTVADSVSLDRPERPHPPSLLLSVTNDTSIACEHARMQTRQAVNLSSPALRHYIRAVRVSNSQAATISTMMTTIIAQSSWPEVCGRRIPRTRCARCHSLSRPSAFPASPSEEKKPASHLTRYRGPPVTPSTPCQDCPSVRGVSQHAGAAIRWLTDARLPSHWQLGVCPQEEAGGMHGTSPAAWE